MRTTVTLDGQLVEELMLVTNAPTKTKAVTRAAEEMIRRAKLAALADLMGAIEVDAGAVDESDAADLARGEWLASLGSSDDA